ncbi:hypothetical protein HET73_06400 [Wolbachia endosymbiont of Atemnus politus]|uniref:hypothetical protein n=1 Tax=Wolbachia endosymbiont of Atemnus politus TaxID=2682840 RepID=UPI0015739B68|nr:hypothetical protein [Wolbachia endosymbiont of Atemnus politus]NSM56951.1 hypothetical protein [Wolbachia endosymbiont of Atemnus politus]
MYLGSLFIGSIVTGIGLVAYGITPIIKLDSLSSLSTTANSLLIIGATALLFPIVTAIVVGITIKITEGVKKYISNKGPSEEDRSSQQIKPERLPDSELSEVSCDNIKDRQTTTANSPQ